MRDRAWYDPRMHLHRAFALALVSPALIVACGDDGPSDSGASAATDDPATGDPSADESADESGGEYTCDASPRDVIAPGVEVLSGMTLAGSTLVVLVTDPGLAAPPRIDAIGVDGSGRTTLATGTDAIRFTSVFAYGDTAYFLQRDYADPVPTDALYSVPITGGTPAPVGDVALEDAAIFDADATGVYIVRNTLTPIGNSFERVDAATGALTNVGAIVDKGTPVQLHASTDRIVFHTGGIGADAGGPREVVALAKDATGATPTLLWMTDPGTDECGLPLGGLFPTPTKIACGFSDVAVRNADGSAPQVLLERAITEPLNVLVATDVENLYLIDTVAPTDRTGTMLRIATDDPTIVPIACDIGKVAYALVDGSFPNQTEYEVVVGATDVFWIEEFFDGAAFQYSLRAIAK